nr:Gag-Pol polyprotein [Tanacetum cinerariifolium]
MFDEYLEPPRAERPDAPSPYISPSSLALQSLSLPPSVIAEPHFMEDHNVAPIDNNPFVNVFAPEPHSEASSSGDISSTESPYISKTLHYLNKWSKDHPFDNVTGNPSRPVSTQKQLAADALWCLYSFVLSKIEPKNFKSVIIEDCWFQAMQDEIHEFDRLQMWELVPQPDCVMIIALKKHDAIDRKNLLIANDKLIAECLSKEVFSVATKSELNVARFAKMHVANTSVEVRCLALEAELATLRDKSHQENQGELIKHFSKLEVDHLNLQLKYQNLKDNIGNHPPTPDKETPDFDSVFVISKMQASLQGKENAICQLKKQLFEVQATYRDTEYTVKVRTTDSQLTKYQNNRDAHLDYLRHPKESIETIRDIIEEAKVVRPLDRSIVFACRYTQHSQELLEYAIGTCPQGSQQRAKQLAHTPRIRKKQDTITKPSNRQYRVKRCPKAGGSQPKSNHKTNRISPAKDDNKLPVEDLPRTNKSHFRTTNHVDSNSGLKRTVINLNSDSICQTCNTCLTSFDHDMCVAIYVKSVVLPHSTRHNCEVERKIKQVWKPKHVARQNNTSLETKTGWKRVEAHRQSFDHHWSPIEAYSSYRSSFDKMADENTPSDQTPTMDPPVRADDQILPHIRWISIGKSNCYVDLEKSQSNPIYNIAVDLLKNTNFFRAFTASSNLPSIYIQQFWDTILYDKKDGCYKCQLDEQWFDLTKETLREALQITPINRNQAFTAPPSIDGLIEFVNQLDYPKLVMNLLTVVTNDLFQPWRALLTIINLCLTGKTSGFERPRAPVLQILWGVVIRANIDYAERIWEEFTQSIHTFIEDKRNLKHMFHPRPDSLLYLSNEEPVLGYLKFSAKGTKREIFVMPIPGRLITTNIREAPYYQEYQENVAKHRGFLASETRSTQDLPAPKLAKPARKPQSTAQKAPPKPSISSPVTSTQPAPTSVPAKTQENKRKQATGTTDKPSKAKRIKRSVSRKTRQSRVSPKSVGASEAEEVPAEEPQVTDEDVDFQKAVEESMKDAYALPKGPLPPVVIREPDSGKYQPLLGVSGKGKAKVSEEQVAHDLLSLQKHKKTSPADQYIFQRRVSEPTASSFHDVSPYEVLGQSDSEEESEKIVLGVEKGSQDEENLKLAIEEPVLLEEPASSSGTLSSLQHLSRDFTFGDQFFSDKPPDANKSAETKVESMVNVPIQQALSSISLMTSPIIDLTLRPESPKEHQQLKATTTDTTTTTTTMLPPPQTPQQSTTEAMMVKRIGELEHTLANLIQVNKTMEERLDKHGAHLYTLEQLDIPQQVSIAVSEVVTDVVDWAMQAPLRNRFRDLPEADMKEILHQRMWETDSYKSHEDHMQLFKALEKSINRDQSEELAHDLAEARKKRKKVRESPKMPPGSPSYQPPPPAGSAAPSPAKMAATTKHQAWSTPDVTLKPLVSLTPEDLDMDEAMGPDEQA